MRLKSIVTLFLITILIYANENDYKWQLINESYINTEKEKIPTLKKQFGNNSIVINFEKKLIQEEYETELQTVPAMQEIIAKISINESDYIEFFKQDSFVNGQKVNIAMCFNNTGDVILPVILSYQDFARASGYYLMFVPKIYKINLNKKIINEVKNGEEILTTKSNYNNTIIENLDDQKNDGDVDYQFYREDLILNQLFKINICSKQKTQENLTQTIPLKKQLINSLSEIEQTLKEKKQLETYNKAFFQNLLEAQVLNSKNLTQYNNIAYYLEQAGAYEESAYLLEKILEKYPDRTVAHYNLAMPTGNWEKKKKPSLPITPISNR